MSAVISQLNKKLLLQFVFITIFYGSLRYNEFINKYIDISKNMN